ncbi:MAG: ribbon-helix-helix domain-containing protein [Bacillota bacterium]
MRRHKTITISIPEDLIEYLDKKILQINRSSYEETNRSQYIRLLIKKDMAAIAAGRTSPPENLEDLGLPDLDYYNSLLDTGGYKR